MIDPDTQKYYVIHKNIIHNPSIISLLSLFGHPTQVAITTKLGVSASAHIIHSLVPRLSPLRNNLSSLPLLTRELKLLRKGENLGTRRHHTCMTMKKICIH